MNAPNNSDLTKLFEIVAKIDAHPFLPNAIHKYNNVNYLAMTNIANEHDEAPEDFKNLMVELAVELDTTLISPSGQHSQAFYDLPKEGWIARTTESDSHGPLGAIVSPPHRKWTVAYG